jgi:hypothetical protein
MRWLVLVLLAACSKPADDCQRAIDRLARIDAAKGRAARNTQGMLETCRTGKHAAHDPVLRCAMDSATDEAAATCVDRFVDAVLAPAAKGSGGGTGLNPLLP